MSLKKETKCYLCSKDSKSTLCKVCEDKETSIYKDILEGIDFNKLINRHTYEFIIKFDKYCQQKNKNTLMPMEIDSCV